MRDFNISGSSLWDSSKCLVNWVGELKSIIQAGQMKPSIILPASDVIFVFYQLCYCYQKIVHVDCLDQNLSLVKSTNNREVIKKGFHEVMLPTQKALQWWLTRLSTILGNKKNTNKYKLIEKNDWTIDFTTKQNRFFVLKYDKIFWANEKYKHFIVNNIYNSEFKFEDKKAGIFKLFVFKLWFWVSSFFKTSSLLVESLFSLLLDELFSFSE